MVVVKNRALGAKKMQWMQKKVMDWWDSYLSEF